MTASNHPDPPPAILDAREKDEVGMALHLALPFCFLFFFLGVWVGGGYADSIPTVQPEGGPSR